LKIRCKFEKLYVILKIRCKSNNSETGRRTRRRRRRRRIFVVLRPGATLLHLVKI
jgi:hypothetical protein